MANKTLVDGTNTHVTTTSSTVQVDVTATGSLLIANNLSDVNNVATSVNNLGGGTATGTGVLVRATSPALVTPNIGVATAQATITSGQDISTPAAIAAIKPVPRLGNTVFSVADSMATLRMVAPAAESRIANLITTSYTSVISNPPYNFSATSVVIA